MRLYAQTYVLSRQSDKSSIRFFLSFSVVTLYYYCRRRVAFKFKALGCLCLAGLLAVVVFGSSHILYYTVVSLLMLGCGRITNRDVKVRKRFACMFKA